MVKSVYIYRNNEYILLSLREYLKEYCNQIPDGWAIIKNWIDRLFEAKTKTDYEDLAKEIQVEYFDFKSIKTAYESLKDEYNTFDDDILRFISFLYGTTYFSKIGNPTIEMWLNATDINHPLKNVDKSDFSFMDAIQFEYGQNAVRKKLMSTLRWISSQGGS